MISNLELTITVWGFFIHLHDSEQTEKRFYAVFYMAGILSLLVYPVVILIFLQKNYEYLDRPAMVAKYSSAYDGIET